MLEICPTTAIDMPACYPLARMRAALFPPAAPRARCRLSHICTQTHAGRALPHARALPPAAIRAALAAFSSSFSVGQPLVLSSLYPVIYSAVSSSSPLFSIRMLTATFGGTTTSDTVNVAWNQKVLIRANQITITESTS